ncbi:Kcnb1 [Symbiodinium pilosum]|uniref:Kcnb1 protein n=1 Tax=Symbiodinium pilosum TaxID=2952 RepID=A0A812V9J2_SYMPI|nr:Kcnb1 [Symbiodinium pilosum]
MYYALIDFHGEFPNADEFSQPLGRMNSMVICLVGTALLSVPAGVLGAAFQDHIASKLSRKSVRFEEGVPPHSTLWGVCMVGLVVLSTANFIFLTLVYQQPVQESDIEGRSYDANAWQTAAIAPSRYLDVIVAVPFLAHWSQRLLCAAQVRKYILSGVHLADLMAWLPSYFLLISLLLHGSCQEFRDSERQSYYSKEQLAFHGMCMFRWVKLDRDLKANQSFFGGMFQQLRYVLEENHVIFRITFVLATALWICGSVLMYYAERDNPDEGTRDHFRTLPLSFWMTGLDFTSEAPVNDHSAQGKAVHTLIMLVGVGVFTVPMGVFGAAFRERLDEMHAEQLLSRHNAPTLNRAEVRRGSGMAVLLAQEEFDNMSVAFDVLAQERASGVYRDVHDVDDEDLMRLQPGSQKYRWYRLLLGKRHPGNGAGARWLQYAIIAVTGLCCFTSCVETLSFFDDCQATASAAEDFDTGLGFSLRAADCSTYSRLLSATASLCLLAILLEFVARCWSHPRPWKMFLHPTGVADVLVISGSLPITLACLGGVSVSYELRNFAVTLRLWRLIALERFVPAFGDFLEVLAGRGYQILQVSYVLTSFWFMMAAFNWYFLHAEFDVKSEDKTFACWYSNFWFAMQYTLIHMSGDYPMTEYPVKAFHDALEKRRILSSQKRNQGRGGKGPGKAFSTNDFRGPHTAEVSSPCVASDVSAFR